MQFFFDLNKEDIVELFCINKDKPEMHCEGTCHLRSESDKEDTRNGSQENTGSILSIVAIDVTTEDVVYHQNIHKLIYPATPVLPVSGIQVFVFHPPRA